MDAEEWREERERQRTQDDATANTPTAKPEKLSAVQRRALRLRDYERLPTTLAAAKAFGRHVFNSAQEAGRSKLELSSMRKRMNEWAQYLKQYEVDVGEIKNNDDLTDKDKSGLIATMNCARDQRRIELFGG